MRNKFPGHCRECNTYVEADAGYFERFQKTWRVRCIPCTATAKLAKGGRLSAPQMAALRKPESE
jgi:hypothetical protein